MAGDYQKITFKNGEAPAINATNLNHMQTQYDKAKELVDTHKAESATQDTLGHIKLSDMTKGSSKIIPIPNSDNWVCPGWVNYLSKDWDIPENRILYIPVYIAEETTFSEVGVYTATGSAGTSVELAIYDFNSNNLPGTLVEYLGTLDTSTPGFKSIATSLLLKEGYYWCAVRVIGGTVSLRGTDSTRPSQAPISGITNVNNGATNGVIPYLNNGTSLGGTAQQPTAFADSTKNVVKFKL